MTVLENFIELAGKHFPQSASSLVELVRPYTELTQLEFAPAKTRVLETWDGREDTNRYDDRDERLRNAVFWFDMLKVKGKVRVIGKDWELFDNAQGWLYTNRFSHFLDDVYEDAVNVRDALDSQAKSHARSLGSVVANHVRKLLCDTGAHRYELCE